MADIVYQHPELVTDSDKQYLPPRVGGFSRSSKKYIYRYHDNSFAEVPSISWLAGLGDESNPANRVKVQWEGSATTVKEALTELNNKIASVLALIPSNIASFKYFGHITDLSLNIGTGYGYLLGSEVSGLDFVSSERVLLQSFSHTENVSQGAGIASPYLQQKIGGITSGKEYYRLGTINPNDGTVSFSAWSTTQRSYVDTATVSADITTANTVKFNAKISSVANNKLSAKSDGLYATQTLPDPNGDSRYVLNGAGNWFQALGNDGLLRADLMPPLAIKETFVVTSQAAMLALTAQRGDVAIRTDVTPNEYYILSADTPSVLSAWKGPISSPLDGVQSINGKAGSNITLDHADLYNLNSDSTKLHVTQTEKDTWSAKEPSISTSTTAKYYRGDKTWQTLDKTAVGLGNVDNTSDANKPISIATQAALDGKSHSSHTHGDIIITDSRSSDTPTNHSTWLSYHFKRNDANSLSDGGTYNKVMNLVGWNDASGGKSHQLGFTDNGNMWMRSGNVGSAWGTWYKIYHSGNFDPSTKASATHTHSHTDLDGNAAIYYSDSDLNSLSGNGHYRGTNMSSAPDSGWWWIESRRHSNDSWRLQVAYPFGTGAGNGSNSDIYWRKMSAGAFGSWEKFWTSGNFDPSTKANTTHTHSTVMHTGGVDTTYSTGTSRSLPTNRTVMPAAGESRNYSVYGNGYPASFGNTTQIYQNGFCTELFLGASGGTASGQTAVNGMWFRNLSDWGSTWSDWSKVWTDKNFDPSTKSSVGHGHSWSDINLGTSVDVTNTNLNNLKTSGIYRGSSLTNGPLAPNHTGWWHIIVSRHDDNWVMQQATLFGSSFAYGGATETDMYVRVCNSGTWTAWKRIWNESNSGSTTENKWHYHGVYTFSDWNGIYNLANNLAGTESRVDSVKRNDVGDGYILATFNANSASARPVKSAQLWFDNANNIHYRSSTDGTTWNRLYQILHSGNLRDSDMGALRCNGWDNYPGFDANAQGVDLGVHFTYANNAPVSGALWYIGNGSYGTQFNTSYLSDRLYFRNRNGDNGSWYSWREVWHTGNFSPSSYVAIGGGNITTNYTHAGTGTVNEVQVVTISGYRQLKLSFTTTASGVLGNSVNTGGGTVSGITRYVGQITNWTSISGATLTGVLLLNGAVVTAGLYTEGTVVTTQVPVYISTDGHIYIQLTVSNYTSGATLCKNMTYMGSIVLM